MNEKSKALKIADALIIILVVTILGLILFGGSTFAEECSIINDEGQSECDQPVITEVPTTTAQTSTVPNPTTTAPVTTDIPLSLPPDTTPETTVIPTTSLEPAPSTTQPGILVINGPADVPRPETPTTEVTIDEPAPNDSLVPAVRVDTTIPDTTQPTVDPLAVELPATGTYTAPLVAVAILFIGLGLLAVTSARR